ncbi:MAG: endonuclease/exonuclease/phosphatase family protein [Fibrobacter sp.]|nr:endonuclease/exonuclease/phosphatase family protein [Fibrobacter sp.]
MIRFVSVLSLLAIALVHSAFAEGLSIASWNIKTIEVKRVYQVEEWNERVPYTVEFIEMMDNDVIGMQEATLIQIDSMLNRMPQYHYVGKASRDGKKSGNYNPIFYKHEKLDLVDSRTFWLSETPNKPSMGWDTDSKRVCTWALFREKDSGITFAVYNTHLDHIGRNARINGAKLILDSLAYHSKVPVFLMGDFNSEKDSEVYNLVNNSGFVKDSYGAAHKKFSSGGTFNAFDTDKEPRKIIDFVFVNEMVEVMRYGVLNNFYWKSGKPRYYSDHFPVRLFVKLKK